VETQAMVNKLTLCSIQAMNVRSVGYDILPHEHMQSIAYTDLSRL